MEYIQGSLFGKTSQGHLVPTKGEISVSSSKSSSKSSNRKPLCLMFRKADGQGRTVTAETDGALRTELLTLNTGEFPNAAVESTLSQILQAEVPEKYYLSAKACEGILRRAAQRGKALPEVLRLALARQAATTYPS